MPVIDIHCHAFHSERPLNEVILGDSLWLSSEIMGPGWTDLLRKGAFPAIEAYIEAMPRLGVDRICLVWPMNTKVGSREVNALHARLVRKYPSQLIAFAAVPPLPGEDGAEELERAVGEYGVKGVKIYPPLHRLPLDAPSMRPIYERAAKLGIPILTHCTPFPQCYTGFRWDMPKTVSTSQTTERGEELDFTYDNIARLFNSGILADYPNLKIIAAHLAGGFFYFTDYVLEKQPDLQRLFKQVYVDVTPPLHYPAEMAERALQVLGEDHVLFGTDYPLCSLEGISGGIDRIRSYRVSDEAKTKILGGNAVQLLGLEA